MSESGTAEVQERVRVRRAAGPERPTVVERAVGLIPLPYGWAALLVALVLGPPGSLVLAFLETRSWSTSLHSYFHGYMPEHAWQQILAVVLWTVFYALLLWVTRTARRSTLRARKALDPLIPGPDGCQDAFRGMSHLGPPLLLGLILWALFFLDYRLRIIEAPGRVSSIYEAISGPPLYLMSGTAVWVYARAVWGLYRVGRGLLRLKPFYEDKSMGLRPMASLSLSLSGAYFSLLFIMVLMLLIGPVRTEYVITVIALLVLGIVLFFVPLIGAHVRMRREKRAVQAAIRARWRPLLAANVGPVPGGDGDEAKAAVAAAVAAAPLAADPATVLALEALERKVSAISTWPFDTPILGRLGVMALTIILGLLTQLFKNLLGL